MAKIVAIAEAATVATTVAVDICLITQAATAMLCVLSRLTLKPNIQLNAQRYLQGQRKACIEFLSTCAGQSSLCPLSAAANKKPLLPQCSSNVI